MRQNFKIYASDGSGTFRKYQSRLTHRFFMLARIGSFDRWSGEYGNGSNEVTFESYTEPILPWSRNTSRRYACVSSFR
jgi:hypothetical protein